MFEFLQAAPADAILGLITEHKNDPRPEKIDLGVGVFRTAEGETPVLDVVKLAEQRLVDTQESKAYIGTAGDPNFNAAMQDLIFSDSVRSRSHRDDPGTRRIRQPARRGQPDPAGTSRREGLGQRPNLGKSHSVTRWGGRDAGSLPVLRHR